MNRAGPPIGDPQVNAKTGSPSQLAAPQPPRIAAALRRILLHTVFLLLAAGAFVLYEHFKIAGQSTSALVSLVAAGILVLAPVRAILGELLDIESKALHLVHGLGGLAFVGLATGGFVSGGPLLSHAALAPFALMGAAQAVMHQDHPRNARQAEALRRFATSLPEVEAFTKGNLTSPENAARAVAVLSDLIGKAQALGETELQADPGFQAALSRATTRLGLGLSLDTFDRAINTLSGNPAAAKAIPGLRAQLATARAVVREHDGGIHRGHS
jgi:hypothetical protein